MRGWQKRTRRAGVRGWQKRTRRAGVRGWQKRTRRAGVSGDPGKNDRGTLAPEHHELNPIEREPRNKTHKGKTRSKTAVVAVPVELAGGEFAAAWERWLAYRRKRRLTCTPETLEGQLAKLAPSAQPAPSRRSATASATAGKAFATATEAQMETENGQQSRDSASDTPPTGTLKQACSDLLDKMAAHEVAMTPEQRAERDGANGCAASVRPKPRSRPPSTIASGSSPCSGTRYARCTLGNFAVVLPKQGDVVAALRGYVDEFPGHYKAGDGIMLFGPAGTGKDHLAVGTCVAIYDRWTQWSGRRGIAFATGLSLYQTIRDRMKEDLTEWKALKPLIDASLLLLSDPLPPRGPLTDWQASVLLEIIDGRYRALRPTIVTLNIASGRRVTSEWGAQTLDRLKDGTSSFYCDWPSHRKATGMNKTNKNVDAVATARAHVTESRHARSAEPWRATAGRSSRPGRYPHSRAGRFESAGIDPSSRNHADRGIQHPPGGTQGKGAKR